MSNTPQPRKPTLVPWALTRGLVCVICRGPNNRPGNPFMKSPTGFKHAKC